MGYRSDVAIELEKKAFSLMKKSLLELKEKEPGTYKYFKPRILKTDFETYVLEWDRLKWYTDAGFVDVDAVENVLSELKEKHTEEKGFGYYKIRIGEDSDDIEEETNCSSFEPNIWSKAIIEISDYSNEINEL